MFGFRLVKLNCFFLFSFLASISDLQWSLRSSPMLSFKNVLKQVSYTDKVVSQQTFVGLEYVFETYSVQQFFVSQDVLKMSWKTKNCYTVDVFTMSWRHVFKTSWRYLLKCLEDKLRHVIEKNKMFKNLFFRNLCLKNLRRIQEFRYSSYF